MTSPPIVKGGVYWVADKHLTLPPDAIRIIKNRRPVIVISGNDTNMDTAWKHILVVPTSTSPQFASPLCVKLKAGVANLDAPTFARIVMPQPIPKTIIGSHIGILPAQIFQTITDNLIAYMDL